MFIMIICFYLLVLNHIQVNSNFFMLHVGILDFKGTMFLFCRLLPCVNKMFIYKEKWYQVRDPQNLNILKGWNLARKSMKRYHALTWKCLLAISFDRNMKYLCNSCNKHYYVLTWSKVPYDFPYH